MPKNFVSPHVHIQSLDSASTPDAFAKREVELGTGAITCTDHGWMGACSDTYELAKKHSLTPILGVEAYLRDDDCDILKKHGIEKDEKGTFASYNKYYHLCIHCKNQQAYSALSERLSWASINRSEKHGSEKKPLFSWSDLEMLGEYDVTMTSGCLIGVVGRHFQQHGRADIAEDYYQRLRGLVKPGNFYVEVFPHKCTHYWESAVYLTFEDGTKRRFRPEKRIRVNGDKGPLEPTAVELSKMFKKLGENVTLTAVKNYRTWDDEKEIKRIVEINAVEGFQENECKPWSPTPDYQKGVNEMLVHFAKKYGDKIIISDDAHYAYAEDKAIQDMKLTSSGGTWKFHNTYNRMSSDEARETLMHTLGIDERTFEEWIDNSHEFKSQFKDFKFVDKVQLPVSRYPADTLSHLRTLIAKHGRMDWNNAAMRERLQKEIELFHKNGTIDLLPYFFLAEEVIDVYRQRRLMTGPGRGSSSGTIISYLLGITHIDPLRFDLSLDRFITLDRIKSGKLPDIDMDLPDRDVLMDPQNGWLVKEFGDKAAAIATKTSLRLKSSIKDVMRSKYGKVPGEIEVLCNRIPLPPQGIDDASWVFGYHSDDGKEVKGLFEESEDLRNFAAQYPEEWEVVKGALGIARGFSRHASAWVLSEVPIHTFAPVTEISGYRTTQYTMGGVEARGGLKMDFLGLACLKDLQDCVDFLQKKNGGLITEDQIINGIKVPGHFCVPIKGQLYSIWDLPEDQAVLRDVAEGKTETVFQLNTKSAIKWLKEFNHWADEENGKKAISSVMDIANFTALDRPGPLDAEVTDPETKRSFNMLQEYARRARGLKPIGEVPALTELLPETYGVLVTQEGLEKAYRVLTECTGAEATDFRGNVAKKKMDKVEKAYPKFMERAGAKIGPIEAQKVWDQMITFGRYGFCKAHAVDYAHIAYACAYFKKHFPLEWWCAVLKNADKKEIVEKFWKFCKNYVNPPDIQFSGAVFEIQGNKIRAPLSFLQGVGPKAHEELVEGRPYTDIAGFCQKIRDRKVAKAVPSIDKETGEPKRDKQGNVKMRLGRSALGAGVVNKLICSGVMDSLFDPDILLVDKLYKYLEISSRLDGKKTFKLDPKWTSIDGIDQYQIMKEILPISAVSLHAVMKNFPHFGVEEIRRGDNVSYKLTNPPDEIKEVFKYYKLPQFPEGLHLLEGNAMEYFNTDFPIETGTRWLIGTFAFIVSDRRFKYAEGKKEAMDLTIDSSGYLFNAVMWPEQDTGKLKGPKEDLTNTICFVILSRYRQDRPATIQAVHVIRAAQGTESEEESSNE
jgi:DNA polymerase III alpha subunit